MKTLYILFVVFLLISCGGMKVDYDYDKQADFSSLKTYNYMPDMQTGMSQLDLNRLTSATDSLLQSRDYVLQQDTPAFLIDITSSQYEQASRNTLGVGVGGGGGNVGIGVGGGIPIGGRELHQTITFNIIDAAKDALIWQAISDSNLKIKASPEKRQAYFHKLVEKIFKKFPPGE